MKRNEPVKKIMAIDLETVHVAQKLSEVRHLMVDKNIHHVPVVSGDKFVGLLSYSDIVRVSFGDPRKQDDRTVDALLDTLEIQQVMTEDVVSVLPSDTVRTAAEKLANGRFHGLPVVDEDKKICGLLTSTDVIKYLLDQY